MEITRPKKTTKERIVLQQDLEAIELSFVTILFGFEFLTKEERTLINMDIENLKTNVLI